MGKWRRFVYQLWLCAVLYKWLTTAVNRTYGVTKFSEPRINRNHELRRSSMKRILSCPALIVCFLVIAVPMFAHHGRGATFKASPVTMKVVVTEVAWRNPHVSFWGDIKDANGTVTRWAFEGPNVSTMTRQKFFRNTLGIGDE